MQPLTAVALIDEATVVCASPGVGSDKGIGYGGVDNDGTKDPASRRWHHHREWEDEEDEEDI